MKKCTHCGSLSIIRTKMQAGFSGSHAFFVEPKRGFFVKWGILPEVWVCKDCKNLMFFVAEKDFEKIYKQ